MARPRAPFAFPCVFRDKNLPPSSYLEIEKSQKIEKKSFFQKRNIEMSKKTRSVSVGRPWSLDIERATTKNRLWRKVVFTGKHLQVVLMSVPPRQELGWEKHGRPKPTDQFFRVDADEASHGLLQMGKRKGQVDYEVELYDGMSAVVPGGYWHNVINTSRRHRLTFYTIYAPPHHAPNTIDRSHSDELRRERRDRKKKSHGGRRHRGRSRK